MIHLASLPHTKLTESFEYCAFSAKVWRLSKMLSMAKIPHIVYGPDVHDKVPETPHMEYVPVVLDQDRMDWFGSPEWPRDKPFDRWDAKDTCWTVTNTRIANEIRKRWAPRDVVAHFGGRCQEQIGSELSDLLPMICEAGIGYSGIVPGSHKVFESYAWMHYLASKNPTDDIRFFDTVIGNMYDIDDFTPNYEQPKDPYLLFMARPIPRKGIDIVADIVKRVDMPVKIAGQPGVNIPGTEHMGVVTGKAKYELLANATALLSPSLYMEPFCGVNIEAMISGTPVIATDWGANTETIIHETTGFRCRMLKEFLSAVEKAPTLDRKVIAEYGKTNYTLPRGAELYSAYFEKLDSLYADGWYSM